MHMKDVSEMLERNGYDVVVDDHSLSVSINNFDAMLTNDVDDLKLMCRICEIGKFTEEQLSQVIFMALESNIAINPFAFAVLESGSEKIEDHLLVITDKVVQEGVTEDSLVDWMEALRVATCQAYEIIKAVK